jgi:hypothetical protein
MTKEQINNRLDYQILRDRKNFYNYKVQKQLFNLTFDFTLNDWRIIQTKKYYTIRDKFNENWQKQNYLLYCVNYYIKHLQVKNN